MNKEQLANKLAFEKKLVENFPILFRDENWKLSGGVSCGPGWDQLIWELSAKLEAIAQTQQAPQKHNIVKKFLYRWVTLVKKRLDIINYNIITHKTFRRSPAGKQYIKLKHKLSNYKPEVIDSIVNKLLEYLAPPHDSRMVVVQVKEKFGGLRFYAHSYTEEARKLIDEAEDKSFTICETCGGEGKTQSPRGWLITMCDEHLAEYIVKRDKYLESLKSSSVDK